MAEFRFSNEHPPAELGNVLRFLSEPRLWIPSTRDYPDFRQWLEKTEAGIAAGTVRTMVAYIQQAPVGAVVYKTDEADESLLKIRNISVSPNARERYMGAFLLRNTEIEASKHDYPAVKRVLVDTKQRNTGMIGFLIANGYQSIGSKDLYSLGTGQDVLLAKSLTST